MTGYAALARVEGGRVRALAWREPPTSADVELIEWRVRGGLAEAADAVDRVDARPFSERLTDTCAALREHWSITTFYLFSPDSWR